jgi:hypothetical protein
VYSKDLYRDMREEHIYHNGIHDDFGVEQEVKIQNFDDEIKTEHLCKTQTYESIVTSEP